MIEEIQRRNAKLYGTSVIIFLAIAVILRLVGINWGMPYIYHPDERLLVARGVHFFSGDLNPHLFIYPSLQMYIIFIFNIIVYLFGHIAGTFSSVQDYTIMYQTNPAVFYITDRFVVVIFAILSIIVTFKLCQRLFGYKSALICLLFFSILPVHVLHSHYVTTDVPCILFILLSFYYSIKILDSNAWEYYILAGIFGGLAAGIKYNGGLIVMCIIFAHWIKTWLESDGDFKRRVFLVFKSTFVSKLIAAISVSILIYLVTSPYTILDFKTFLKDFIFQVSAQRRGHGLIFVGINNKFLHQLFVNLRHWGGPFIWLLMIAGVIRTLFKIDKYRLLILSWVFLYFMAMISSNDLFIRYTLLLVPFLIMLSADFTGTVIFGNTRLVNKIFVGSIFTFAILYMGTYSVIIAQTLSKPDVRTVAKEWFDTNSARGATIGIMTSPTGMKHRDDPPLDKNKYVIYRDRSLPALIEKSPEWLVISSYDYIDYMRLKDRYKFTKENYNTLLKLKDGQTGYKLAKQFDSSPKFFGHKFLGEFPIHDMMYNFPVILMYKKL